MSSLLNISLGNFSAMASSNKPTTANSDLMFSKQVDAAQDALKNFNAISQLNAPSLIKTAMDELVASMVSHSVILHFWPS
jgi:hypothetical protein